MQSVTQQDSKYKGREGSSSRNSSPGDYLATDLAPSDRRLLLISSLTLFLRRARHGFVVTGDDLLRLSLYADPPQPENKGLGAAA